MIIPSFIQLCSKHSTYVSPAVTVDSLHADDAACFVISVQMYDTIWMRFGFKFKN